MEIKYSREVVYVVQLSRISFKQKFRQTSKLTIKCKS